MNKQQVIHGTAMEIFGYGIVLLGKSGSGKSETALKLIDRGHKFIADDHILIKSDHDGLLWIYPHANSFIHLSEIGFIDIVKTYGDKVITDSKVQCNLFIELNNQSLNSSRRISEELTHMTILAQEIPLNKIYAAHNRPLELLIEILVKKQQQLDIGYNAHETFINNLHKVSLTG
jgi:HPr kinase/phosphorylase